MLKNILRRENLLMLQKMTGTIFLKLEMRGIKNNEILEQKSELERPSAVDSYCVHAWFV
jgi:hypothetical protein